MNLHKLLQRVGEFLNKLHCSNFCMFNKNKEVGMNIVEAIEALKSGKALARSTWNNSGEYVLWLVGAEHLFKVTRNPTNGGGYALTFTDLCADDWVEVTREDMEAFCKPAPVVAEVVEAVAA